MPLKSFWSFAFMVGALSACSPSPNTTKTGIYSYEPNPGYQWEEPDAWFNYKTIWRAGLIHPNHQHITSSRTENEWIADDGYTFPTENDLSVRWQSNARSRIHPHVYTGQSEGTWDPAIGYVWTDSSRGGVSNFNVRWQAGLRYPNYPHMESHAIEGRFQADDGYVFGANDLVATWRPNVPSRIRPNLYSGTREGAWVPAPGYDWADPAGGAGDYSVVWMPGARSPLMPNMYASTLQGYWYPDTGYQLQRQSDGSLLAVALPAQTPYSPPSGPNYGRALAFGVGAIAADSCSRPQEGDGLLASLGRLACGYARDAAGQEVRRSLRSSN